MSELLVSYLEMTKPPTTQRLPPRPELTIVREANLSGSQYLHLQNAVGGPWQWDERQSLEDGDLRAIIHDPQIDILVIYCSGITAGFCELDRRRFPDIEIKFFGLMPEFIGQGLGAYFLDRAIHAAWQYRPTRLWLHTDTNDHPRALLTYKRAGFQVYKQALETF